jgi:hypothetical protein
MICELGEILAALGKGNTATDEEVAAARAAQYWAERSVKKYLLSGVEQATYQEVLPNGQLYRYTDDDLTRFEEIGGQVVAYSYEQMTDRLPLGETPVRSVTAVYETYTEGGGGWPAGSLLDPSAYYLDAREVGLSQTGHVVRLGSWSSVPRSVKVVYVAGYTADELRLDGRWPEFKLAVRLQAAKNFRTTQSLHDHALGLAPIGPVVSESVQGASVSVDAGSAKLLAGQLMTLTPEVQEMLFEHRNLNRLGV